MTMGNDVQTADVFDRNYPSAFEKELTAANLSEFIQFINNGPKNGAIELMRLSKFLGNNAEYAKVVASELDLARLHAYAPKGFANQISRLQPDVYFKRAVDSDIRMINEGKYFEAGKAVSSYDEKIRRACRESCAEELLKFLKERTGEEKGKLVKRCVNEMTGAALAFGVAGELGDALFAVLPGDYMEKTTPMYLQAINIEYLRPYAIKQLKRFMNKEPSLATDVRKHISEVFRHKDTISLYGASLTARPRNLARRVFSHKPEPAPLRA